MQTTHGLVDTVFSNVARNQQLGRIWSKEFVKDQDYIEKSQRNAVPFQQEGVF